MKALSLTHAFSTCIRVYYDQAMLTGQSWARLKADEHVYYGSLSHFRSRTPRSSAAI